MQLKTGSGAFYTTQSIDELGLLYSFWACKWQEYYSTDNFYNKTDHRDQLQTADKYRQHTLA